MKKKLKDITIGEYMAVCKRMCDEDRSCKDCPFSAQTRPNFYECRIMYVEGYSQKALEAEIEMEEEKK